MLNSQWSQSGGMDEDVEFFPLVSLEDADMENDNLENIGEIIPILPLRNTVLFPGVVMPITVGREKSIKAIKLAHKNNRHVGVLAQLNTNSDDPEPQDLYTVGVVARIIKTLRMPDGSTTVILQGIERFKVTEYLPNDACLQARITLLPPSPIPTDKAFKALVSTIKDLTAQFINLSPNIPSEANTMLRGLDKPTFLVNFVASNLATEQAEKQSLLEMLSIKDRALKLLEYLMSEVQMLELKNQIQMKAKIDMDKQQRDYFLQQQIKTIQEELGDSAGQDVEDFYERAGEKKWSDAVRTVFEREIVRVQRLNPAAPEYSLTLNYIELLLDLPWNEYTPDNFDLHRAQKVLDKDHSGLEKIKKRIMEYLAVLKLKEDMKSPILCFVGPPGVGKTSLGRSIANALKRKYVRMSLGGLHDESEIRGHRRTYIGSMPGRIIQSIKKSGSSNPVFILDEIDKVGSDFRGDPASALLEVLDPEQNNAFYDNYLEVEYDLSKVMFIATANSLSGIHPALLDRMEIIHISGYSLEEKLDIAKAHLIPKQREAHGINGKQVTLSPKVLTKIIGEYTRESGVRILDQKIAAVMRSVAMSVAMQEAYNVRFTEADVERVLGAAIYDKDFYEDKNPPGVAIGLAWTETGGDILFIETLLGKGKGTLTLTGNLGDVMKESATTAMSYIQAYPEEWGINSDIFANTNFHIHVPEGAIPKDGPSAGVTMLTSLLSALTKRKVNPRIAMTGEITLRGKVLPVGGIKEKVLAAKRAGIQQIILCAGNKKDVDEMKPEYVKDLQFSYVKEMREVLEIALEKA